MRRYLYLGWGLMMLGVACGIGQVLFEKSAAAQGSLGHDRDRRFLELFAGPLSAHGRRAP